MEMDIQLYEKCSRENNEKTRKLEADKEASQQKWNSIMDQATAAGIDIHKL
jgi:biopolymer transport protein ExbD